MSASTSFASEADLPPDWVAAEIPGAGVELRVSAGGRPYITGTVSILAILALWKTVTLRNVVPIENIVPWMGIAIFLLLFALWLGFADEVWLLERNSVNHRVGIGRFGHSTKLQNAELTIIIGHSTIYGVPYYRLNAIIDGKPRFLLERNEKDLKKLANFISTHTGWPIR